MPTLADLAHRCAQETQRFFEGQSYDPRYCFELFRLAIVERNQPAWEVIHAQYQSLVAGWVRQHRGFEASGEEAQYFVNRAFEKIWVALTPDKFGRFSDLGPLLRYLKMCVHSVIVDHNRSVDQANRYAVSEESDIERRAQDPTIEDRALDRVHGRQFWEWINARLHDEKERHVVYGSFVLGLKPRQIHDLFPETFQDVAEVHRVKQNVLARLRRDPEFQKLLDEHD